MTNDVEPDGTPEAHFGRAVREGRIEFGWTQAELAERMELFTGEPYTQSTVAKTEAGSRPIRLNEAADLASVLRRDLLEMTRHPGTRAELVSQRATVKAQIRMLNREAMDIAMKKQKLEYELEIVATELQQLDVEEDDDGVGQEEA